MPRCSPQAAGCRQYLIFRNDLQKSTPPQISWEKFFLQAWYIAMFYATWSIEEFLTTPFAAFQFE